MTRVVDVCGRGKWNIHVSSVILVSKILLLCAVLTLTGLSVSSGTGLIADACESNELICAYRTCLKNESVPQRVIDSVWTIGCSRCGNMSATIEFKECVLKKLNEDRKAVWAVVANLRKLQRCFEIIDLLNIGDRNDTLTLEDTDGELYANSSSSADTINATSVLYEPFNSTSKYD